MASTNAIVPNHTIIIVDSTHYLSLHNLIEKRFPNNPVCAFYTEANLRQTPSNHHQSSSSSSTNNTTTDNNNTTIPKNNNSEETVVSNELDDENDDTQNPLYYILHSGQSTKTTFSPISSRFSSALSFKYKSMVVALQNSGIEAIISPSYDVSQWSNVIPFLSFECLSVLLESPTPQSLINNVLSKPLYMGLINELMELATRHSNYAFPQNYAQSIVDKFVNSQSHFSYNFKNASSDNSTNENNESSTSSFSSTSSLTFAISDPPYLDSPLLFYNYFHSLSIYPDLMLLQPILLADDYGIKTPYLESVFAYLSQMVSYNNSNNSVFLTRIPEKFISSDKDNLVNAFSKLSYRGNNDSNNNNDDVAIKIKELEAKEQALNEKESLLNNREQKLNQWAFQLQRQQSQQFNNNNISNSPNPNNPPSNGAKLQRFSSASSVPPNMGYNNNNNLYKPRPVSAVPPPINGPKMAPPFPPQQFQGPPAPPIPQIDPDQLDMMSITSRKNRRYVPSSSSISENPFGPVRNSNSSASLAQTFNTAGPVPLPSRGSFINNNNNNHRGFARSSSISEFVMNESNELNLFGSMTSNRYGTVDSSRLVKSRANSLTVDSLMGRSSTPQQYNNNNHYVTGPPPHHSISSPALYNGPTFPSRQPSMSNASPYEIANMAQQSNGRRGSLYNNPYASNQYNNNNNNSNGNQDETSIQQPISRRTSPRSLQPKLQEEDEGENPYLNNNNKNRQQQKSKANGFYIASNSSPEVTPPGSSTTFPPTCIATASGGAN